MHRGAKPGPGFGLGQGVRVEESGPMTWEQASQALAKHLLRVRIDIEAVMMCVSGYNRGEAEDAHFCLTLALQQIDNAIADLRRVD